MRENLHATYLIRSSADAIGARAQALALEQSIEVPLAALTDARIERDVVAQVESISARGSDLYAVRLALALETVGDDAGQLMNMLFGNSSLLTDIQLEDIDLSTAAATRFGGPALGIAGIRARVRVAERALTSTALKPIGSSVAQVSRMAALFADAGIDVIKEDHGWAESARSPFRVRVPACQRAIAAANRGKDEHESLSQYAPSLSGDLDQMRVQLRCALECGVTMALAAPMTMGCAGFQTLRREFPQVALLAHPAFAGTQIAPGALLGKLFRLFGADAVIFPNHGGRFAFPRDVCAAIAAGNRAPWLGLKPSLPTPAGGMSVERVAEIISEYGRDAMLLIGGSLLIARDQLAARSRAFVSSVAQASDAVTA